MFPTPFVKGLILPLKSWVMHILVNFLGGTTTLPTELTTFVGGMGVLLGGMGVFLSGTRPFHSTKQLERELIGSKASSCLGFSPNFNGFPFSHICT